jgi:hypothetical protein
MKMVIKCSYVVLIAARLLDGKRLRSFLSNLIGVITFTLAGAVISALAGVVTGKLHEARSVPLRPCWCCHRQVQSNIYP